jgi:hypothetical protein
MELFNFFNNFFSPLVMTQKGSPTPLPDMEKAPPKKAI